MIKQMAKQLFGLFTGLNGKIMAWIGGALAVLGAFGAVYMKGKREGVRRYTDRQVSETVSALKKARDVENEIRTASSNDIDSVMRDNNWYRP